MSLMKITVACVKDLPCRHHNFKPCAHMGWDDEPPMNTNVYVWLNSRCSQARYELELMTVGRN